MNIKGIKQITASLLLSLLLPLTACSQTKILNNLPTGDGVSKVYISKAMIKLGGNIAGDSLGKYRSLVDEINSIEIYNSTNPKQFSSTKTAVDDILKQYKAEELVYSEDDGESSSILLLPDEKSEKYAAGLAILNLEPGEISVIIIHGKINLENLAEISN